MTRLPHMIHQLVGYCWVITTKEIIHISLLWIHFYILRIKCSFLGEKLESYCYVVISVVFVHYLVSHQLIYFYTSSWVTSRLVVYFISDNNNIIRMYLATYTKVAMFSDEMSSSATVALILSPCVSINFFFWTSFSFVFRLFYLSSKFLSFLKFEYSVSPSILFSSFWFLYIFRCCECWLSWIR